MKRILKRFNELSNTQKIEFILASLCSIMLIIGVPVFAWFYYANNLETMTQIKEPDNLDIRAGNFDPIINLELSNIDIEDMQKNGTSQYYVFSVSAGDYKINYNIQLAYTTNIPFKYTIWRATKVSGSGENIVAYHPLNNVDEVTYYKKDASPLELIPLNADEDNTSHYGRVIAQSNGTYYDKTYLDGDQPEIYAVPMYLKTATPVTPTEKGDHDYFILQLDWDITAATESAFAQWNKAENNKETDIIYISASRSTG